jgi:hypothetical protein
MRFPHQAKKNATDSTDITDSKGSQKSVKSVAFFFALDGF